MARATHWTEFPVADLGLRLLVVHRLHLERWEHADLRAPYWRLYHNSQPGARIRPVGQRWQELRPGHVTLIPPETSFASRLERPVHHFYVHFVMRPPHRREGHPVYDVPVSPALARDLAPFEEHSSEASALGGWVWTCHATRLVSHALSHVPGPELESGLRDERMAKTIAWMLDRLDRPPSNREAATFAGMHPNAFVKRFRARVGVSPQRYLRGRRVAEACVLLHHTDWSMERIAEATGFCDRFHLTRAFTAMRGVTPAAFRSMRMRGRG